MAVAEDVRAHLNTLSLNVPVYIGPARPANPPAMPAGAVFVLETGGLQPQPYMDGATTAYRRVRVQIRVRGEPNDYATARSRALTIWSAMQQTTSITGSYTRVTNDQSYPMYMGFDQFQCPEFIVNATLEKEF
jgi:Bacteriophage minor capsid protein